MTLLTTRAPSENELSPSLCPQGEVVGTHPQSYSFPPRGSWLPLAAPSGKNRVSVPPRCPLITTSRGSRPRASSSVDRSAPPPFPASVSLFPQCSSAELDPLEPCMVRAALRGPAPGRAAVFLKYARPQRQGTSLTAAHLLRRPQPGPC
jgi:hypothetical protein